MTMFYCSSILNALGRQSSGVAFRPSRKHKQYLAWFLVGQMSAKKRPLYFFWSIPLYSFGLLGFIGIECLHRLMCSLAWHCIPRKRYKWEYDKPEGQ